MSYSDIHSHALYACDDGAKTVEEMYAIIDASYQDGVRHIIFTPHFHFGYFKDNTQKRDVAFQHVTAYANNKYPDLVVALGNELRYEKGCVSYLSSGQCKTMNNTKYVLVDFHEKANKTSIADGLNDLLSSGYLPILAHAERYVSLFGNLGFISEYRRKGVKIQVDTQSISGKFGILVRLFSRLILKNRLADFVSSDTHNTNLRPPGISETFNYIEKKIGRNYAKSVCYNKAIKLLF